MMGIYKGKKLEKIFRWGLRITILLIVIVYAVSLYFLPVENDEFFEENLVKKYDTEITEEDVLYKGTFKHILKDGTKEPVTLPCRINAERGERVTISSKIPDDYNEDYIIVRSSQQNLTIYIGGIARVTYDTSDSRPFGNQTTSRYVFCRTSAEDAGKLLHIKTVSESASYSGTLNAVYSCDRYIFWKYILGLSFATVILGIASLVIGVFIIVLGISLSRIMKFRNSLEYAGWCVMLAGTWLTCESKVRQLITTNSSALSNICFLVIMISPVPLLLYINGVQKQRNSGIFNVLVVVASVNTVLQTVIAVLGISDFLSMLVISHIILAASILAGILTIITDIRSGAFRDYYETCIGLIAVLTGALLEIIMTYFYTMMYGAFLIIGVIVFIVFAVLQSIRQYRELAKAQQDEELREQKAHSDAMTMQMIKSLSDILESKEEHMKGHSSRVAVYSVMIARKLGVKEPDISRLYYAASLHDIGKIGVSDSILNKPGKLTLEEYNVMKMHTTIGADILKGIEFISYTEEVARYHHERYDGLGYPEALAGEYIPFMARIVAVADAYDAMNSKRIYRDRYSDEYIREEMIKNRGAQFDPEIVDAFLQLYDNNELIAPDFDAIVGDIAMIDVENALKAGQVFSAVVNTIQNKVETDNIDLLTGLSLRNKGESAIGNAMKMSGGTLIFFDMDNLKTVNDVYGHKRGDMALKTFGDIIRDASEKLISCRVGGDEFISYYVGAGREEAEKLVESVIETYAQKQINLPTVSRTSLSAGLYVATAGERFEDARSKADKALYFVKKSGKNNYSFYLDVVNPAPQNAHLPDLSNLMGAIKTSGSYYGSLNIEYREFTKLYEYIEKLCKRYDHTCHLVLVTLETVPDSIVDLDDFENAMECMGVAIKENIRNVDVCTRYSSVQYLVILLEAGDQNIDLVMQRVFERYHSVCRSKEYIPKYQSSSMNDKQI